MKDTKKRRNDFIDKNGMNKYIKRHVSIYSVEGENMCIMVEVKYMKVS